MYPHSVHISVPITLFISMYPSLCSYQCTPHSPSKIFLFSLICLSLCKYLLPIIMFSEFQRRNNGQDLSLVCGYCASNVYQCGLPLFWPTFQTFPAECQCNAARCVTAYLWCCCDVQASTCMSSSSIWSQGK